jgi:hypothetical protein
LCSTDIIIQLFRIFDFGLSTVSLLDFSSEKYQIHCKIQQVSGALEHFFLDGDFMRRQKVHAPVEVLHLDGLFNIQMDIIGSLFFHRQLGDRRQRPVGHQGKDGSRWSV